MDKDSIIYELKYIDNQVTYILKGGYKSVNKSLFGQSVNTQKMIKKYPIDCDKLKKK